MRRRTFLKEFGAGAMLLGSGSLLTACGRTDSGVSTQIGLQLFTLRSQLQADVRKTLADVAAIGYKEVEPFGLGGCPARYDTEVFALYVRCCQDGVAVLY